MNSTKRVAPYARVSTNHGLPRDFSCVSAPERRRCLAGVFLPRRSIRPAQHAPQCQVRVMELGLDGAHGHAQISGNLAVCISADIMQQNYIPFVSRKTADCPA
jgi:hypothetical protein